MPKFEPVCKFETIYHFMVVALSFQFYYSRLGHIVRVLSYVTGIMTVIQDVGSYFQLLSTNSHHHHRLPHTMRMFSNCGFSYDSSSAWNTLPTFCMNYWSPLEIHFLLAPVYHDYFILPALFFCQCSTPLSTLFCLNALIVALVSLATYILGSIPI